MPTPGWFWGTSISIILADARAEDLLDLMEVAGLDNWLPEGAITYQCGKAATIDLVLASHSLKKTSLLQY